MGYDILWRSPDARADALGEPFCGGSGVAYNPAVRAVSRTSSCHQGPSPKSNDLRDALSPLHPHWNLALSNRCHMKHRDSRVGDCDMHTQAMEALRSQQAAEEGESKRTGDAHRTPEDFYNRR
jgi:hypothetical protein